MGNEGEDVLPGDGSTGPPRILLPLANHSMIFWAASRIPRVKIFSPDSARILRPNSTFVPSIRTTRGTRRGFSRRASTIPWA